MIKKLIGIIAMLAVMAIIVIVIIRRDNFRSMIQRERIEVQAAPASTPPTTHIPAPVAADAVDSARVNAVDSL
ncbi:hypothetical protein [uncultured Alistipes sp.]|jgi:hypothetical protein|uniref:hypothetical protein n=1 Tax=uncultured Alistipes sp. TaxID=538949 RepID=UPI0025D0A87B|nr:hypothetical protein [uncultured Alistipes sp.]